jgi:hypothetical protein
LFRHKKASVCKGANDARAILLFGERKCWLSALVRRAGNGSALQKRLIRAIWIFTQLLIAHFDAGATRRRNVARNLGAHWI